MEKLKLDDILNIVNEAKEKRGFENYAPCYPMLRIVGNKLYIAVMISDLKNDIWNKNSNCKPEYWCLIDINTHQILEYNKTSEKDFITGTLSEKSNEQNELSELEEVKAEEYTNYFLNDILKTELPLQKELFKELNDKVVIEGKEINLNSYMMDNLEDVVKIKAKELVDILLQSKYSLITICYENLFNEIIDEYKGNGKININKINLCIKVMQNYYYGIIGIKEFFNV